MRVFFARHVNPMLRTFVDPFAHVLSNCPDNVLIGQHTNLPGIDADIISYASELFAYEIVWRRVNGLDTLGVLSGQCRHY